MGSEARARIGLFILLVTTLFEFTGLFVPGNFFGPGLLAIVIAGGIAMGMRRVGIGTLLTLVVSAAGLIVYVTFVFANRFTWWGVPSPVAVREVIDATQRALDKASLDFAPVPVRTGYVILMVLGLWLITTLGEIATFRWKRPMLASLPAIGMFTMLMVVGKAEGASVRAVFFLIALLLYWGLESSHRLRSWGRWVPTWSGIDDDYEPVSVTGTIARNMGLLCVVIALVSPLFLPALNEGLLAWRTGPGEGEGFGSGLGPGGQIDPFVSMAPGILRQTDRTLFTVEAGGASYWRLVTLPVFDDGGWRPTTATVGAAPIEGEQLPTVVPPTAPMETLQQSVSISGLEGQLLPAAPTPNTIAVDDRQGDIRYRAATGDLILSGNVDEGLSYTVESRVPAFTYEDIRDARVGGGPGGYTDLPGTLSSDVVALRDGWIRNADSPYERLVAIQNNLVSPPFIYSTQPAAADAAEGDSIDYLETFLLQTRAGYCQQYASAFAALSRSLGYPTRLVVGFLPGAPAGGGRFVVRGTDAHAWPEVYFEEFGWVAFEPTPRRGEDDGTALAPDYTSPDLSGGAPATNLRLPTLPDAPPTDQRLPPQALSNLPSPAAGGPGGSAAGAEPAWQATFTRLIFSLAVLTILFLAAVPALKMWRIRRLYARSQTNRDLAGAAFQEFLLEAAELASPRAAAETAPAYVRRLTRARPLPKDSAAQLAAIYDACQYAPIDPSEQVAARARGLAAELKTHLWMNASWWQKARRLFAPSFVGRARPAGAVTGLFR